SASAGWAVLDLIFTLPYFDEGFETVIFVSAQFQQGLTPALGAVGGLIGAAIIGALLFKWGVKIDIRLFFKLMGILLLLIVAGLVVSALKHFDAAVGILSQMDTNFQALCIWGDRTSPIHSCILGPLVWNATEFLPDREFPGIILKSLLGYRDKLYLLQAVGYIMFLATVGSIYFQKLSGGNIAATNTQSVKAN
ncbi:MAG: hypothetical protein HC849_24975, partial [Oscillatoriales cyanobacterium RU_3_3]|nr:hypothetical protein [Oscillatoriales cyanobacterium RU_3_3]